MSELISQELVINGHYVKIDYKAGKPIDISIQENDGTILFSDSPEKLGVVCAINQILVETEQKNYRNEPMPIVVNK